MGRKQIKTLSSLWKFLFRKKGSTTTTDWNVIHDDLLKLLLNVLANIVHQDLSVKPKLLQRMALYKHEIRKLADTSTDLEAKCKFLNKNQKGSLFPLFAALISLLSVAAPVITKAGLAIGATAASAAIAKKIADG